MLIKMAGEKDLQNKILNYKILEARMEGLVKQREAIMSKISEIDSVIEGLGEIAEKKEVLFSIGGDAYVEGVIKKDSILIDIGAGILIEKTIEEGKEILNKRKKELDKAINDIENEIKNISIIMNELSLQIQSSS
jgi:prefoldin alpha subunit